MIRLKKDIEGKLGTIPRGSVLKIVKAYQYPSNINLTVQDKDGNLAVIMIDKGREFPHDIVVAN